MRKDTYSTKIRLQIYLLATKRRLQQFASTGWGRVALSMLGCLFLFSIFVLLSAARPSTSNARFPEVASPGLKKEPIMQSLLSKFWKSYTYITQDELEKLESDPRFAQTDQRTRLIVLSRGEDKINTGVWPGWGGTFPYKSTLNWGTAGVVVEKDCPVKCDITHDNAKLYQADLVVTEMINYPKFGHRDYPPPPTRNRNNPRYSLTQRTGYPFFRVPIPPQLPAQAVFYYEPESYDPDFTLQSPIVASQYEYSATQRQGSTVPVTLTCNWGRTTEDFLAPPVSKGEQRFIMYLSEHGVSDKYRPIIDQLFREADKDRHVGIHAYRHRKNKDLPNSLQGDRYTLSGMLDFMAQYKFILITDPVAVDDFVSPEFSQAILAGVVPVYFGASNIHHFAPGPGSFIDGRRFKNGQELWSYLRNFSTLGFRENTGGLTAAEKAEVHEAYSQFFLWKTHAREEYSRDIRGQKLRFGAARGYFLNRLQLAPSEVELALENWPLPDAFDYTALEANTQKFRTLTHNAWNIFRTNLDYCVHYAECRLCELAHSVT